MKRLFGKSLMGATLAVGLILGTLAMADTKAIEDPDEMQEGYIDIKKAVAGHSEDGRLKHKVVTYDGGRPCLYIKVPGETEWYFVCNERQGVTQDGETRGGATINQPAPNTFVFFFKKRSLGSPSYYKWRWIAQLPHKCCDYAPNEGWVRHDL